MAYTQIQKIENHEPLANDKWGTLSIVDGYHMISGSEFGTNKVDIYKRDINEVWQYIGSRNWGSLADMFGNYFAVIRPNTQSLRIYDKDDFASPLQIIDGTAAGGTPTFGNSVSIGENYIVIGDQAKDSNTGQIFIYEKTGVDSWTAYANNPVTADFTNTQDFFGSAVATNDESIIVGAMGDNNKKGAVYIFQKDADTGVWEQTQKIFASDGLANDQFGESVSVSGYHFVAGASLKDSLSGDIDSGAAYVFKYSTVWNEIDKLVSVDENSPQGDHFGESVNINGDYIIVGSPASRGQGVADVFYKKRSWDHLKKIVGSDTGPDDDFGTSVSVSGRFIVVGSPDNESATTGGSVYVYEDPSVRLRLAQEFEVNAEYLPTKASTYLKRVGENTSDYWPIYNTAKTVIDTTNFSTIDTGANIVTFEDSLLSFTGNGYMYLNSDRSSTFSTINYPVRAIVPDTFNLWIRCLTTVSTNFQIDVLVDGVKTKTIDGSTSEPSALTWGWVNTTIVLPDTREHILGIKIKENGVAIDKLYIDASNNTPYSEGPDYGESPYLTIHMKVYDSSNESPNNSLFIYDYKNSIEQVVQSDWYNFNINVLDNNHGYTSVSDFTGNYFLVMSSSGTTHDNFVVWEMADNDEYMTLPSAFRF